MKQIPLTQGKVTLVDDEDFEYLNQWKWHAMADDYTFYVGRKEGWPIQKTIRMHRVITNAPGGMFVDHINGNGLDNRRSNLRLCTVAENNRNIKGNHRNTTGYKGVTWHKRDHVFIAQIRVNGKLFQVGRFSNALEAAKAYDKVAKEYHGDFASLNFPEGVS